MTRTHWKSLAVFLVALTVLAVGCRSTSHQSVGQNIDDKTILASVKTKLVADKASNLTKVDVDVTNGTVYLTGNVDSAEQKSRGERIARDVNGVRSVVNNLEVQKK
jgi:hyperosmotically inducible protein